MSKISERVSNIVAHLTSLSHKYMVTSFLTGRVFRLQLALSAPLAVICRRYLVAVMRWTGRRQRGVLLTSGRRRPLVSSTPR